MPTKPTSGTTSSAKPTVKSSTKSTKSTAKPKLTVKELQELHDVQAAEEQATAEDAERKEHQSAIDAVPIILTDDQAAGASGGNQTAKATKSASQVKATKWLREKCWNILTKQAKFPLARLASDEGVLLFSAEQESKRYVFVTHHAVGDNREDDISRAVDTYQAALEQHGLDVERVMYNGQTHVRLQVTRTDDDAKQATVRTPVTRSLKRLSDDDQDQEQGSGI